MGTYDRTMALRAAAITALLTLLALIVIGATDEGSAWGVRLARLAAVAPVAAGVATGLTLASAAARGELRALLAVGVSQARARRGSMVGAAVIGLVGVGLLGSPAADLGGLFPRLESSAHVKVVDGRFVDTVRGLTIDLEGKITPSTPAEPAERRASQERGSHGSTSRRAFAVLSLALAALGAPAWAGVPMRPAWRALIALAVVLAEIGLFHVAALDPELAAWLVVPPLVLFAAAVWAFGHRGVVPNRL